MAVTVVVYEDLPDRVRAAVEAETGPVFTVETVSSGLNSALSARVRTAGGSVFLKGLPVGHRWAWTQGRESEINPYVVPLAPRLLFRVVAAGWDVLGFEVVDGRHADYAPGSPDLPLVADALLELGGLRCPDVELRRAEQRLAAYVDRPADADAFRGDALLHTDWNNRNVLVADGRARVVDWAWATRGAAWLDPAHWVIWLIAAGHTPAGAEELAGRLPAWGAAPPRAVDAFACAGANLWTEIGGADPDDWTRRLLTAARLWWRHRRG
ncbi:aminoglycoside phosphotransferase [Streptomyces sp. NPDC050610]|uniref:aminoglycoside phosphotransferase n=1 Tax=Streptomyces sp. NPDC050610 TaxID=3157097 RepID=UPI00341EFD0E